MRILYFYQYFCTPKGSWGTRIYEFASEWVAQGHDVTVVTTVYAKSDIKADRFIDTQYHNGIRVKVINLGVDNRQAVPRRILGFIAYALVSSWYAIRLPADVVVASSGPITVGIPGLVARYLRRRRLVFETRDLWPEGAIELGIIRNRTVKRMAYLLEKACYRASTCIVALSPGMKENIEQRSAHPRVFSVTNSANLALFGSPMPFNGYGKLDRKRYAIYSGNIGEVNNAWWMYHAASILKDMGRDDIVILMVGEGQQKEAILEEARRNGISNLLFFDLMPKTELVALVQHALVSLVPLKGTPVLDTSSPNKFFESLAAGVPVIQTTNGWMRDFIERHVVGFTVDPERPQALADLLIKLWDDGEAVMRLSSNAASTAATHFDKRRLAADMLAALERAVH